MTLEKFSFKAFTKEGRSLRQLGRRGQTHMLQPGCSTQAHGPFMQGHGGHLWPFVSTNQLLFVHIRSECSISNAINRKTKVTVFNFISVILLTHKLQFHDSYFTQRFEDLYKAP